MPVCCGIHSDWNFYLSVADTKQLILAGIVTQESEFLFLDVRWDEKKCIYRVPYNYIIERMRVLAVYHATNKIFTLCENLHQQ